KQLQTKNGGTFSAYQQNLADGLHLVKVDSITNIGAVDANQSLSIKSLKNLPAGQIIGRFAGMIYISKTGNKYVVAYGYKTGLIFLIAISKAVITTNDTGKRVVIKNLSKGEYIIS
ncbi:MAG: hypothetical protein JXR53_01215, partial [Bacteroidales bacterium]|nr:hypothetical protein [Bacteroidales bacterium]